ncbi:MAG: NAD(P)H-binding protein [Terriglobales bacterium]|jgi:uncharacterized protein YbjT (DUF2867 family)
MILVTGATGNVGREVVKLLLNDGQKVVAVTRNPTTAALHGGAHVVGGDPSRPKSLTSALSGIEAILLSPRALGDAAPELLMLAAEQGVQRVVLLSAATVEHGGGSRHFADQFKAVEDAVTASGLPWTFLRCADFASNARVWAPQIRLSSSVRGAYGDAATSTIHERDIAAVAARVLVPSEHCGRSYLLTGPQSLTQREKVRLIGEAIGKNLLWEEISPQEVRQAMIARGVPADVPDRMLGYLADRVEQPGPSSDTVEQILSRPALTFSEWAVEHVADFTN